MIIRHSVFKSDPWGDGGSRRTAQITELLGNSGLNATFLHWPNSGGRLISPDSITAIRFLRRTRFPVCVGVQYLRTVGPDLRSFRKQLAELPPGTLVIWEGTQSRFSYLPLLAREFRIRVIALPHNLESLVPGSCSFNTGRLAPKWLDEEIHSLALCDKVFAISREDQWLLRLHGITAAYLPYFPPRVVVNTMLKIRKERSKTNFGRHFLLLGTAANRPTFSGMADRLEFFFKNAESYDTLHVAGYGTELLRAFLPSSEKIILHGAIDNLLLHSLLSTVRAAIIHQVPTSGALTRISELLIAGVPVFANIDAGRSYFGAAGVHVYENDEQLLEMLSGIMEAFSAPAEPVSLFENFLTSIKGAI